MILAEPTEKSTYWLYASCDVCGLVCDFESCHHRKFTNPKGGTVSCPEGCKSEFTTAEDAFVNYLIAHHAVEHHRWQFVYDDNDRRYLICANHFNERETQ